MVPSWKTRRSAARASERWRHSPDLSTFLLCFQPFCDALDLSAVDAKPAEPALQEDQRWLRVLPDRGPQDSELG